MTPGEWGMLALAVVLMLAAFKLGEVLADALERLHRRREARRTDAYRRLFLDGSWFR